jgi:V8-like Glu-specific endopeptidase
LSLNIGTSTLTRGAEKPEIGIAKHALRTTEKILDTRPVDTRYPIDVTTEWPNCLFGQITTLTGRGSGTLVGPNIVLTAAHILYDKKENEETDLNSIYFCPAKNRYNEPYGNIKVTNVYYPESYKTDQLGRDHDWALLILEENIGYVIQDNVKEQGWFDLKVCSDDELGRTIHIFGYPGEKLDELWAVTGRPRDIKKNVITYELDTTNGQSGGGVLAEFNGKKYIVASHQGGISSAFNWATRWTMDKHLKYLEFVCQWDINTIFIDECINKYKVLTSPTLTYGELWDACLKVNLLGKELQKVNKERNKEDVKCNMVMACNLMHIDNITWMMNYGKNSTHLTITQEALWHGFPIKPRIDEFKEALKKDLL